MHSTVVGKKKLAVLQYLYSPSLFQFYSMLFHDSSTLEASEQHGKGGAGLGRVIEMILMLKLFMVYYENPAHFCKESCIAESTV